MDQLLSPTSVGALLLENQSDLGPMAIVSAFSAAEQTDKSISKSSNNVQSKENARIFVAALDKAQRMLFVHGKCIGGCFPTCRGVVCSNLLRKREPLDPKLVKHCFDATKVLAAVLEPSSRHTLEYICKVLRDAAYDTSEIPNTTRGDHDPQKQDKKQTSKPSGETYHPPSRLLWSEKVNKITQILETERADLRLWRTRRNETASRVERKQATLRGLDLSQAEDGEQLRALQDEVQDLSVEYQNLLSSRQSATEVTKRMHDRVIEVEARISTLIPELEHETKLLENAQEELKALCDKTSVLLSTSNPGHIDELHLPFSELNFAMEEQVRLREGIEAVTKLDQVATDGLKWDTMKNNELTVQVASLEKKLNVVTNERDHTNKVCTPRPNWQNVFAKDNLPGLVDVFNGIDRLEEFIDPHVEYTRNRQSVDLSHQKSLSPEKRKLAYTDKRSKQTEKYDGNQATKSIGGTISPRSARRRSGIIEKETVSPEFTKRAVKRMVKIVQNDEKDETVDTELKSARQDLEILLREIEKTKQDVESMEETVQQRMKVRVGKKLNRVKILTKAGFMRRRSGGLVASNKSSSTFTVSKIQPSKTKSDSNSQLSIATNIRISMQLRKRLAGQRQKLNKPKTVERSGVNTQERKFKNHESSGAKKARMASGLKSGSAVDDISPVATLPIKPETDANKYFVGLGMGTDIPEFLRFEGKVRRRDILKADLENLVNQVWAAKKIHNAQFKKKEKRMKLDEFFIEYLEGKYASRTVVAEWGYNVMHALEENIWDADIHLFLLVLTGQMSEEVHNDQIRMLTALQMLFARVDEEELKFVIRMKTEDENGILHKRNDFDKSSGRVFHGNVFANLRAFFPKKSEQRLNQLQLAFAKNVDENAVLGVKYDFLFEESKEGNQGAFVEEVRTQHLTEIKEYSEFICDAILQVHTRADGTAAVNSIRTEIQKADPELTSGKLDRLTRIGTGNPSKREPTVRFIKVKSFAQGLKNSLLAPCLHFDPNCMINVDCSDEYADQLLSKIDDSVVRAVTPTTTLAGSEIDGNKNRAKVVSALDVARAVVKTAKRSERDVDFKLEMHIKGEPDLKEVAGNEQKLSSHSQSQAQTERIREYVRATRTGQ